MKTDLNWLTKWQTTLVDKNVLELGCGNGVDTRQLLNLAQKLTVCDQDLSEIKKAGFSQTNLKLLKLDHSEPLPFANEYFDVVVASLTLHYFKWNTTINIIQEISRVLIPKGLLICRLNSTNDRHYGSVGHIEIEAGLFNVFGSPKRFFDEPDISALFLDWLTLELEEKTIDRYLLPKVIWEFGTRKK